MQVETTSKEYIIRLPKSAFNADEIDRLTNDLRLQEIASNLKGTEQEAQKLAKEINQSWWKNHRKNFIQ